MVPSVRQCASVVLVCATCLLGACGDSEPPAPATTTTARATGTPTNAVVGDATAGRTVFETKCQVCHLAGGAEAGPGPKLVGRGLTEEAIRAQVQRPRNAMPPNIVAGKDLDDVTAFILRLQEAP